MSVGSAEYTIFYYQRHKYYKYRSDDATSAENYLRDASATAVAQYLCLTHIDEPWHGHCRDK